MELQVRDSLIRQLPELTPMLTTIDISQTSVTSFSLSSCIASLPLLYKLTLRECPALFSDKDAAAAVATKRLLLRLSRHGCLRALDVSNNQSLTDDMWREALTLSPLAQAEEVDGGEVGEGEVHVGGESAAAVETVQEEDIGSKEEPKVALPPQTKGKIIRWTSLDISFNEKMTDVSIAPLLLRLPNLEQFQMQSMSINVTDAILVEVLQHKKRLECLNISGCCHLNGSGLEAVLKACKTLVSLKVSGLNSMQGLTQESMRIISTLDFLVTLDVSANKTITLDFLSTLLDQSKHLQCLNLNGVPEVNEEMITGMRKLHKNIKVNWNRPPAFLKRPKRTFLAPVKNDKKGKKKGGKKKGGKKKKK